MKSANDRKPGIGRALLAFGLAVAGIAILSRFGFQTPPQQPASASVALPETFRLVHAIGNSERVNASGLSSAECETRKRDLKIVAEALGTYNERLGIGSITCLPDRLFND